MNAGQAVHALDPWTAISRKEAGQHAAMTRKGLEWRTLEHLAWERFHALLRGADPRALRHLACDIATAVLPIFEAAYPDDHRPVVAIEVARHYAAGTAGEAERIAASTLVVACARGFEGRNDPAYAAYAAASAAGFTLWKRAEQMFEPSVHWAAVARGEDGHGAAHKLRYVAALEAIQR